MGLQGVEDVELLVHTERQQLLDDLGGVGTPEEEEQEERKEEEEKGWRPSTTQLIGGTTTRTRHHQAAEPAGRGNSVFKIKAIFLKCA